MKSDVIIVFLDPDFLWRENSGDSSRVESGHMYYCNRRRTHSSRNSARRRYKLIRDTATEQGMGHSEWPM